MLCQLQLRYHNVLVFLAVGVQDCVVLSNTLCHLGNYEIVPPVLLPLLTQQQISLFVCWRGRLHWVLLVTPLWALIPWRNIHMCNFERLVLIGMMHPSGCSWSCLICEHGFLHPDWKPDSQGVCWAFYGRFTKYELTRRLVVRVSAFYQHEKRNRLGGRERFAKECERLRTDDIVRIGDLQSWRDYSS